MELNVDALTTFFIKISKPESFELEEQAETGSESASGKPVKKWESGLTRGKANQLGNTKWESGRKFDKTYMNDPKYKWVSGRVMGKTGGSDFA
jgi:hypothetical protein